MRSFLCFATVGIVALAVDGYAQDSKKQPATGEITKAMFWVPNQHCPDCATALEGSMRKIGGYVWRGRALVPTSSAQKFLGARRVKRARVGRRIVSTTQVKHGCRGKCSFSKHFRRQCE